MTTALQVFTSILIFLMCMPPVLLAQGPAPGAGIDVLELYGKWQSEEDGTIIEIGPVERGDNSKIKVKGRHDDWGGSYDGRKLQVIRKPKAEEMDDKAPLWARQEVAKQGTLWWSLDLTPQSDGCTGMKLSGQWFRGELIWTEEGDGPQAKREASSSGKYVNPVDVHYKKVGGDAGTLELSGHPTIVALPNRTRAFSDYFLADGSLDSVYKTQAFDLFVRMPRSMADDAGNSISVALKSAKTGSNANITLTRYSYSAAGPVIYRRDEPVIIADPGSGAGDIGLKAENEDRITVTYPGAESIKFAVYNSQWQFGMAANEQAFLAMLALYNSIILESQDARAKEAAHRKMLMINNARHLINDYKPAPLPALYVDLKGTLKHWDKITDITRFFIGRRYLDLLEKNTDIVPNPGPDDVRGPISPQVRDRFFETLGITLTGGFELTELIKGFEDGERAFKDTFWKEFMPQYSMGLYQVAAFTHQLNPVSQNVEQVLILVIGVDIFGKPVDKTTKILNAINLGSTLLLKSVNFVRFLDKFTVRSSNPFQLRSAPAALAEAGDLVGARKPEEVLLESIPGAIEVRFPRTPVATPLQGRADTCLMMVLMGHMRDAGLPFISEDIMTAFGESFGAYKYLQGGKRLEAAKMLESMGMKATVIGSNLNAIGAALKKGLQVNLAVVVEGGSRHAIRIRDVLTGPDQVTWVHFEDPWNGKLWRMEDKAFCKIVAKDPLGRFENVMFVDPKGLLKGTIKLSDQ